MSDEDFMELALEQAKAAKNSGEWPFGAVIVSGKKVVAQNQCAERVQKNVLAHAELQAVGDACSFLGRNKLDDCTIFCTNEPCLMCAAAIFQAKIPRVVIGASRADLGRLFRERKFRIDDLAKDSGYNIEIVRGVLKEKVIDLFRDIKKG